MNSTVEAELPADDKPSELPTSGTGPLRVCVIISSFRPVIGGAERVTERLCSVLHHRGIDVRILTRRYPGLSRSQTISGVLVARLGHPSRTKAGALTFALHALWALATELRDYRLVQVQNPDTPLLVGFLARLLLGRKLLVTIHSDPDVIFTREAANRRLRLVAMGRLARLVGVQSPETANVLRAEGVPADRLGLLPNGVDTAIYRPSSVLERQQARERIGLSHDAIAFLFVGRLVTLKRVDLLLRAWAKKPFENRGVLIIVGEGPERAGLEALARRLKLSNVRFEGETDDVLPYLQASEVFVLPSTVEGLSIALLEAMASGLCPVVSDLPANRAVVENGHNGLTFRVDDLEDLGRCLYEVGASEEWRRMSAQAVETVNERFSLSAAADLHVQAYLDLLQ